MLDSVHHTDIAAALDMDWIDAALGLLNLDIPKSVHPRGYRGFADMSGGRSDSAALAIAHFDPDSKQIIVDAVRRWQPPFSPEAVVNDMAEILGNNETFRSAGLYVFERTASSEFGSRSEQCRRRWRD